MIYTFPGQTNVESVVQGFPTGLTGTVGFRIRDNNGADFLARRTTGIVEDIAGSGVYRTTFTAPTNAGQYEIWWDKGSVTPSNVATEDLVVAFTLPSFTPSTALDYITEAELKYTLSLTGTTFADDDLSAVITAASRAVDEHTGQRFYADPDATRVRYYTANGTDTLRIDPLITLTSLQTDASDDGTFENTWVSGTDFLLEPRNALADGVPYNSVRMLTAGTYTWPTYADGVKVTGQFGWASVPEQVKVATTILAARYAKRMRESPTGVQGFDAIGAVVRVSMFDPDVEQLLIPYTIRRRIA